MDRDIYSNEIREIIRADLKRTVGGEFSAHREYPYFVKKTYYDMKTEIEGLPLYPRELPEILLNWAGLDPATPWKMEDFLVLDLETSGLSRGSTIAILIGLGYFENGRYVVEQVFLPEPEAELSSFDRLIELMQTKSVFITFNGKSFDIPMLESRLLYNQIWLNLREKGHIDLLHLARRLWKNRAPNCALETLEFYILGHIRDAELDIEGADIPQTYYQYLINGDPELINRIFIHNQYDILHTAALFALIGDAISNPVQVGADHRIDYYAVAKHYQKEGREDLALQIMEELLRQGTLSAALALDLGLLTKKTDKALALEHFRRAAELDHSEAILELAKLQESFAKDYSGALGSCEHLLQIYLRNYLNNEKKIQALQKRMQRLQARLEKAANPPKKRSKDSLSVPKPSDSGCGEHQPD